MVPALTAVYLELGPKKVFACSLEWPGWCRSGKDEAAALEAFAAYAPRYAAVAKEAGFRFSAKSAGAGVEVVERVDGSASTDFGVPGAILASDWDALTKKEGDRLARAVEAAWAVLDRVAAGAPAELRKGPRGGGRDRDKIVAHVTDAEVVYVKKMGLKVAGGDELRAALPAALRDPASVEVPAKGWPPRYVARRTAWHALDHAWEIEDRIPGDSE